MAKDNQPSDAFLTKLADIVRRAIEAEGLDLVPYYEYDTAVQWGVQDPDSGYHFTVEVAGL